MGSTVCNRLVRKAGSLCLMSRVSYFPLCVFCLVGEGVIGIFGVSTVGVSRVVVEVQRVAVGVSGGYVEDVC